MAAKVRKAMEVKKAMEGWPYFARGARKGKLWA
jgi:hypothetical protein